MTVAAGLALIAGVTSGRAFDWSWAGRKFAQAAAPSRPPTPVVVEDAPVARDTKFTTSFAPVVKRVAPSVVHVFTEKIIRPAQRPDLAPFMNDPVFRWFFGDRFDEDAGPRMRPRKETNLGSGVIVTADGYILTNNHVVDGADEVKVSLANDRKRYDAKVVGRDPKTDIAVLKVDGADFSYVAFADSDKLEVGDVVLAVGNPFGLGQTVTMGIVSATGRRGLGIEEYEDFIQTDAAINPGNSGGALVDAEGRLVGINTAIFSRTGGNQGIGFAVPANLARNVMERIRQHGRVVRGQLGVWMQDVTPELAREFNLKEEQGVLVTDVVPDSAAETAGIKPEDVITEFNGKAVRDMRQLRLLVGELAPGTSADVRLVRAGKERRITVKLKELPEQAPLASRERAAPEDEESLKGVEVGDLDADVRQQLSIPSAVRGALITNLDPSSAAADAGLRRGDVILEIDRKPVKGAAEAVELSQRVRSKRTLVKVWSQGSTRYVVVDESQKR
jgi:serine protease Do